MDIRDELKQRRIFFDGGMGSMLQERGLLPGELPETWNLSHPEAVKEIHLEYLRAGAAVVTANTFGANGFKYKKEEGYSLGSIVTAGVSLAKEAVKEAGHGYAAPQGGVWPPTGTWISRMHVRRIKRWWRLESGLEPIWSSLRPWETAMS